jgi:hypothetical protein
MTGGDEFSQPRKKKRYTRRVGSQSGTIARGQSIVELIGLFRYVLTWSNGESFDSCFIACDVLPIPPRGEGPIRFDALHCDFSDDQKDDW